MNAGLVVAACSQIGVIYVLLTEDYNAVDTNKMLIFHSIIVPNSNVICYKIIDNVL